MTMMQDKLGEALTRRAPSEKKTLKLKEPPVLRPLNPIALLNDQCRRTGIGCECVITRGVARLGALGAIMQMVKEFDGFTIENDPVTNMITARLVTMA